MSEMPMDNLAAEEKLLLEWKDDNAAVYYEFKQSLEKELAQPYHQMLLDMGDGNAGPCSMSVSIWGQLCLKMVLTLTSYIPRR